LAAAELISIKQLALGPSEASTPITSCYKRMETEQVP